MRNSFDLNTSKKRLLFLVLLSVAMISTNMRPASFITFGLISFVGSLLTGYNTNNFDGKCVKRVMKKELQLDVSIET